MTRYGVREFLAAARTRRAEIKQTLDELHREAALAKSRTDEVVQAAVAALDDLTAAIVPDFTPASFQRALTLTGYRKLVESDPIAQREKERAGLQDWLVKIEKDPRWIDRVKLRDPRVGTLTREIAELEEFRAPSAEVVAKCQHPRLQRLLESGYGTSKYDVAFWRVSYYADWEAGDEILERWPDKKDFGEVREEFLSAAGTLKSYDDRLASLRAEFDAGADLEKRHAAATESLRTLDERSLAQARKGLGKHVSETPEGVLGPLIAQDPSLEVLAKKYYGLDKKAEYLSQLAETQLGPQEAALIEEDRKLAHDQIKYARPKKAGTVFPPEQFEKRFVGRRDRWEKFRTRYRTTHETIYVYDDWNRGRLSDDFLWWDLYTDGRYDGSYLPSVATFRSSHPGYRYERTWRDDDAAAAVARADRTRDDSRGHDAS